MEITRKNNISALLVLMRLRRKVSAEKVAQVWWTVAFLLLLLSAASDSIEFLMIAALNIAAATSYRMKNEKDKS